MSRYRATVLTPTLVGDGNKLAPIDYMVWKDQVNVLDQRRIFKLLAKGSRLDSYLAQIRKVEKLDFGAWGGYAQNYALRRIGLEDASVAEVHLRERAENLFIPTFAGSEAQGAFLPATALKGPLRTAFLGRRLKEGVLQELVERPAGDRPLRHPGLALEHAIGGEGSLSRARSLSLADGALTSQAAPTRIYLVRTSTLLDRGKNGLELGWKTSTRGSVDAKRVADSTPYLVEMATPGAEFQGAWNLAAGLQQPGTLKMLRWKEAPGPASFAEAANLLAKRLLALQKEYARQAGLGDVERTVDALDRRLEELSAYPQSCLLCVGWGGGYLTKSFLAEGSQEAFRTILRDSPFFGSAIRSGLPFPKTRKIVFLKGRPASLPGWVQLDFLD
jgi:CRISPR-associated protein Csm5